MCEKLLGYKCLLIVTEQGLSEIKKWLFDRREIFIRIKSDLLIAEKDSHE